MVSKLIGLGAMAVGMAWLLVAPAEISEVLREDLQLHATRGVFLLDGEPFTGRALDHSDHGQLVSVESFKHGRRHGARLWYHPNGVLGQRSPYVDGRLQGVSTTWFSSGQIRSEGHWQAGVAQGIHKQWYASGGRFKERHLTDGKELGMQRAWRENGALYNNYEARDGRIYGLRRSRLCINVDEEEVLLAP